MALSPLAGKPATPELLIDVQKVLSEYHDRKPDMSDPQQRVSFGTSGHRGSPLDGSFTESHILAISQAICDYRKSKGISGPLFMGMDTHAVSAPAQRTALEVLAANGVEVIIQENDGFTPTPVISHAILNYNWRRTSKLADGIVITPSHNPPKDGGFKYNPTNGGPADVDITQWVQDRANKLLENYNRDVERFSYEIASKAETTYARDLAAPYIDDLAKVIDMKTIKDSGVRIGVDPLGGASVHYWEPIKAKYGIDLTVVNKTVDPTFRFMTVDHDGQIRMDCSSPYAAAKLIGLKDDFQVAFGNDPDADRHGIVAPSVGLLNPNHYLAVAVRYLMTHRPQWGKQVAIGKTLVSSGIIDRVAASLGRKVVEVPVGFKWFVTGLFGGTLGFGGEESAGASFLRLDGSVWTTDKDGPILGLLAGEMTGRTGKDPGEHFKEIAGQFGMPYYKRSDEPATPAQKDILKKLSPQQVSETELAGERIIAKLTQAPGNGAAIGGLKVTTQNGWFAARPSGTENVYKIYAESFRSEQHLDRIMSEARAIVARALGGK
jgi:phosphoglucomutase